MGWRELIFVHLVGWWVGLPTKLSLVENFCQLSKVDVTWALSHTPGGKGYASFVHFNWLSLLLSLKILVLYFAFCLKQLVIHDNSLKSISITSFGKCNSKNLSQYNHQFNLKCMCTKHFSMGLWIST